MLMIHFSDLNFETIIEEPAYQVTIALDSAIYMDKLYVNQNTKGRYFKQGFLYISKHWKF